MPQYVKTLPHRAQVTPHGKALAHFANAVNDLVDHIPVIAERVGKSFEKTAKEIEQEFRRRREMNNQNILNHADNFERNYQPQRMSHQPVYNSGYFERGRGQGYGDSRYGPPRFSNRSNGYFNYGGGYQY